MFLFTSTYPLKLDDKGRFFLPPKYREELGDGLVITRGHDYCLAVYRQDRFDQMAEQLLEQSDWYPDVRAAKRLLGSGAFPTKADGQWRVAIPPVLRDYAQLDVTGRDIVVTGVLDHAEIWDSALWNVYQRKAEPGYSEATKPVGLGAVPPAE